MLSFAIKASDYLDVLFLEFYLAGSACEPDFRRTNERAKGFQQADEENNDPLSAVPHGSPILIVLR